MACRCEPKRYVVASLAVAAAYFLLDMFYHHTCLMGIYQATMNLWRPMEESRGLMPFAYAGYLLFGFLFTCLYSVGVEEGKGRLGQGIRYGFWIGLFYWGTHLLLMVPFTPYPTRLVIDWFLGGMFEFLVLGGITGLLYKSKASV